MRSRRCRRRPGAIADVALGLRDGKAPGPDLVPPELLRYSGPSCWGLLGHIAFEISQRGLPHAWRGGVMVPVPRRCKEPLTLGNARGVFCEDSAPKAIGKVARANSVGALVELAGAGQCGSVPGGGTDLASSYVRHVLEWARRSQVTIAILFTDIGAAFYSCLTEEAVGRILASPRRAAALAKLGFSEAEAAAFAAKVEVRMSRCRRRVWLVAVWLPAGWHCWRTGTGSRGSLPGLTACGS